MRKVRVWSLVLALVMLLTVGLPSALAAQNPKSIVIEGPLTVAAGCSVQLNAKVSPGDASQEVKWKSSNKKIATVSENGLVTGLKKGQVKITAVSTEDSSVKASVRITVLAKAVKAIKITAETTELYLSGKKSVVLNAKASPSSALQEFTWQSNNPKVAKVNANGKVTAVGVGTAIISATAMDGSGVKRDITITVTQTKPKPGSTTKYYALLIGNGPGYWYLNKLSGIPKDIKGVKNALKGMKEQWQITVKENLTVPQMKNAIEKAFAGATEKDVCLFYYSGHGDDGTGSTAGALCGIECDGLENGLFTPAELRDCLSAAAPGKVIVLVDSCGSGASIYAGSKSGSAGNPQAFTRGLISALSGGTVKEYSNTGELLDIGKFSVIVACKYGTVSMGAYVTKKSMDDYLAGKNDTPYIPGSTFTYALCRAMGFDYPGRTPIGQGADSNNDGELTLHEMFTKIKSIISQMDNRWREFLVKVEEIEGEDLSDLMDEFAQATQWSGTADTVLFTKRNPSTRE